MKMIGFSKFLLSYYFLFLTILLSFSCGKEVDDSPSGKDDQSIAVIGSEGGALTLKNGVRIVIPPGALSSNTEIKLTNFDPEDFFDGGLENHYVVGCEPDGLNFAKEVEVYFPVQKALSGKSFEGLAGMIDPASGAVEVYPSSGLSVDGEDFLVIKTEHFSKYTAYLWETPPSEVPPIQIPHYNQGETPYCWAAGVQMLCEAVKHDVFEIPDVIGWNAVSEEGLGQYEFRYSSKLAGYTKTCTGVSPDRKIFSVLSAYSLEFYLKQRLALGYPVLIHSPVQEHAFLVVGYKNNNFYLNDPASVNYSGDLCYNVKSWADFKIKDMELSAKFVTFSIPKEITCANRLQTINVTQNGFSFIKRKAPDPPTEFRFVYDYEKARGYSYKDKLDLKVDPIPGDVTELMFKEIQLSNSSKSQSKTVSVQIDIWGENNKKIHKSFKSEAPISLPPNSLVQYFQKILVADFIDSTNKTTDYKMVVSAFDQGGSLLDDSRIFFSIAAPKIDTGGGINYTNYYASPPTTQYLYNDYFTADVSTTVSGEKFRIVNETNLKMLKQLTIGVPKISDWTKKVYEVHVVMNNVKINTGPWNPNAKSAYIKSASYNLNGKETVLDASGVWNIPVEIDKDSNTKTIYVDVVLDLIGKNDKPMNQAYGHSIVNAWITIDK